MDLYKELLINILTGEETTVIFPNLTLNPAEIIEMECYKTLKKIKTIIENDSLSDVECFKQIEEIVCVFENLGSGGGNRHDFG